MAEALLSHPSHMFISSSHPPSHSAITAPLGDNGAVVTESESVLVKKSISKEEYDKRNEGEDVGARRIRVGDGVDESGREESGMCVRVSADASAEYATLSARSC